MTAEPGTYVPAARVTAYLFSASCVSAAEHGSGGDQGGGWLGNEKLGMRRLRR